MQSCCVALYATPVKEKRGMVKSNGAALIISGADIRSLFFLVPSLYQYVYLIASRIPPGQVLRNM